MHQPEEEGKKTPPPTPQEQKGLSVGPKKPTQTRRRRNTKVPVSADQLSGTPASSGLDPSLYINKELSWLEFNQRVLEEAQDHRHPLLERVKFLSIVSTNLDEFFMIRVAGIKEQILANVVEYSPDGRVPTEQLTVIHKRASRMMDDMRSCFWNDLHPKLKTNGIHLLKMNELTEEERRILSGLFAREIFPVLTPLAFDPGHPFPYISNLSLSLALVVRTPEGEERFARLKVPDVLPRLVSIPAGTAENPPNRFVWLEDLIADNLETLFPGMEVRESYVFRVTRNADIEIQEDEAEDLLRSIEESVRLRRFGSVVRVSVQNTMPQRIKDILVENLEVTQDDVYTVQPPVGLAHLMSLLKLPRPDLKDPPHFPAPLAFEEEVEDLFGMIRRGDLALHHPYDSFNPVVSFLRTAAHDPNVLAIKQTLYRIGKESPLVPLFIEAAENGKQVAVLVELKARFDEENNIIWAKQLERAGVHVVYGLVGLKTHAKMALVVRREGDSLRRYVHLGTGNYNPVTARVYTDLSYFTCREEIVQEVSEVFNFLTGYSKLDAYSKLAVAPVNLRGRITELIDREIRNAKQGYAARLIWKMNSLTDQKMIQKLYAASQAGVTIDLIVRGICCLRPGVQGVSEKIRVISIVGRFLEHSRVYYCLNHDKPELFLSSADLMERNLNKRVELMFPIEDAAIAARIKSEVLDIALRDNVRARRLNPDGTYTRIEPRDGEDLIDSQMAQILTRTLAPSTPVS